MEILYLMTSGIFSGKLGMLVIIEIDHKIVVFLQLHQYLLPFL